MIYAQFYRPSTGYVPGSIPPRYDAAHVSPIEVPGWDGGMVLDARQTRASQHLVAAATCARRGFTGYRLFSGARFSDARALDKYVPVSPAS